MNFCTNCRINKKRCPRALKVKTVETDRKVLPQGTIIHGDYQIYGVLGAGGMSVTYCACTRLKPFVLKQFNPTAENRKNLNMQKERATFIGEARKLLILNHPNIVKIENIISDEENIFLAMEFLIGESVQSYLDRTNRIFSEQHAYNLMRNIFDALETVHQKGMIHRDVKPSNIMICALDQTMKLIDFGNARQIDTHTKSAVVSSGYAPIEQYDPHGKQGTWTDVYALSAVLYRLITGKEPQPSYLRCIQDNMHAPLGMEHGEALMKGLAVQPQDRWQTIGELRAALGNLKTKAISKISSRNRQTKHVRDASYDRPTEYVRDASWDKKTNYIQHDHSVSGEKDDVQVFEQYKKAAESGDIDGMIHLIRCYRKGIGTKKNWKEAWRWSKKVAEITVESE